MFQNSLYRIDTVDRGDYSVSFDGHHRIFASHFPGKPVLPGACIIEMTRQMASDYFGSSLDIIRCRMVKFLKMIEPEEVSSAVFSFGTIEDKPDTVRISTIVRSDDSSIIFARLDMEYRKI